MENRDEIQAFDLHTFVVLPVCALHARYKARCSTIALKVVGSRDQAMRSKEKGKTTKLGDHLFMSLVHKLFTMGELGWVYGTV